MDFSKFKAWSIPEGVVTKVMRGTSLLWQLVQGELPLAYQQVEWIEAAANVGAYINLGFKYDGGAIIRMTQYIGEDIATSTYPFGAVEGQKRCAVSSPYSNTATIYGSTGTAYLSTDTGVVKNTFNVFHLEYIPGAWVVKNITAGFNSGVSNTLGTYSISTNLLLFAQNYNGSPRFGGMRRISEFEYFDVNGNGDTIVLETLARDATGHVTKVN